MQSWKRVTWSHRANSKFFKILSLKIKDYRIFSLLQKIIGSFSSCRGVGRGMPIGNLTSQIFANIYLNELDRFVKHVLRVRNFRLFVPPLLNF
jgi:RNA-directed DNA polymerase